MLFHSGETYSIYFEFKLFGLVKIHSLRQTVITNATVFFKVLVIFWKIFTVMVNGMLVRMTLSCGMEMK